MKNGLVISGEKNVIKTLGVVLSEAAEIRTAATVKKAIEEIMYHPAEFTVLDSYTRDIDPLGAVTKLLQIQESLPIIVIVPSRKSPLADELRGAGAFAVVERPIDPGEIVEWVERAMEKKQLVDKIKYLKTGGIPFRGGEITSGRKDNQYYYREVLRRFSKAISQVLDHKKLLDLAVEAIIETFNSSKAIILLIDQKTGKYVPIAYSGYSERVSSLRSLDPADALPSWLAKQAQILISRKLSAPDQFELHRQVDSLEGEVVSGLFAKGKLVGVMAIGKKVTGKLFSDDDLELLSILTNYLAMAIENALLYKDIEKGRVHNEKVLNHLKTGVITIDSRGRVTTVNKAAEEILQIESGDIVGEKVEKLGSLFADILLRTMAGRVEYTRREISSPIEKKPLEVSTSVMRDGGGVIDGAIMVITDLSRIKDLEEKEKNLERLEFWSMMAGRLAHEVKNPLVPIKTFAQLLPQRFDDEEFRGEFFKIVNNELDKIDCIITRLAKFAEQPQPVMKPTRVYNVIENALKPLSKKCRGKNVKIVKKFAEGNPVTQMDEALFSEAIMHIVDNAIDAVSEKGSVVITTSTKGVLNGNNGSLEIVISDNGRGIAKDELGDIFVPFASSKINGMGLGLPITQRIILDHHGSIEVISTPGKRTDVRVTIPMEN